MPRNSDSAYWHDHAEEVRELAEMMSDPAARMVLYELAARWDELADKADIHPRQRVEAPRA